MGRGKEREIKEGGRSWGWLRVGKKGKVNQEHVRKGKETKSTPDEISSETESREARRMK